VIHLSIVICTKDRPDDLNRLLDSITHQNLLPNSLIVVDGSDDPVEHVVKRFSGLNIDYIAVRPPSLPKQRNVGISRLKKETDWVGFLDDDLVLEKDSFEQIVNSIYTFKGLKALGGISMMITNVPEAPYSPLRGLFLLDHKQDGHFTSSACSGMLRKINNTIEVQWLSGGVTFWSKKVLDEHSFDEWFAGTGYMEDVDFSYSVSKNYSLAYCGTAKCEHFQHPVSKKKMYTLGVWQITAWWYFVKKFKDFNKLATLWSMIGLTFINLAQGIFKPASNRFDKFLGNLKGLTLVLLGQATKKRTWHK
tara:strand:+ start:2921 stop:3838 length:918 start_codon:yes stop_codon:yes gene_type:complete